MGNDLLYEAFPNIDENVLRTYKAQYINEIEFALFEEQQSKLGVVSSLKDKNNLDFRDLKT